MKKLFTLFFALIFANVVFAAKWDIYIYGIYYKLDKKHLTAQVTNSNGDLFSESYSGSVVIPSTITVGGGKTYSVTSIKENAFAHCKKLTTVTIPNSVQTIGNHVFDGCTSLTSISIPNSVITIGNWAFSGCTNLTSISIPNSVITIGNWAFEGCSSLTSVNIPNSVTTIGSGAFRGCSGLTSVNIPNSVKKIEIMAFDDCSNLISLAIPNTITKIDYLAFNGCIKLTSVTIPTSVKVIYSNAFKDCLKLKEVYLLSDSITMMPESQVFTNCNIDNLYCGHSTNLTGAGGIIKNVHRLTDEEIAIHQSFSKYAQVYVESRVNDWQKKGSFEKTSDWQKRVTDETRKKKIEELLKEAQQKYLIPYTAQQKYSFMFESYDSENEICLIKETNLGDLLIPVPIKDAPYVQQNWSSCIAAPHYAFVGTDVVVQSIDFAFPNGKSYTYQSSQDLTYTQADIQYNFDPIDLNLGTTFSSSQPKGQQTIQQKQLTIGKSAVDTNIPQTNSVNDKTFVVIVANEDYESVAYVPFAKNDGNTVKKYCINTLGIPEKNIHLREDATLNNMRSELGWLKQVCEAYKGEASVLFYYAGHGIPDENDKSAYLLPSDGDGRYVQSGYKLDDLYQILGSMQAKSVTVFMDACFSGSQRGSGMLASARGVALKAKSGVPQGNMVVFSAAQGDETAYPNNEQGHGMFTYYLLKKLQETKGDVTLKDLGDYIKTNVSQQSIVLNSKSQTPCVTPASAVADSWQNWKLK